MVFCLVSLSGGGAHRFLFREIRNGLALLAHLGFFGIGQLIDLLRIGEIVRTRKFEMAIAPGAQP